MTVMAVEFFNTYGLALELLLASAMFTRHLKRREKFWPRALIACAGLLCISL